MKPLFLMVLILLGMVGCDKSAIPGEPVKAAWDHAQVSIIWHRSARDLSLHCDEGSVGCSRSSSNPKTACEIWAPEPQVWDDHSTLILGHEVLHCFTGAQHASN